MQLNATHIPGAFCIYFPCVPCCFKQKEQTRSSWLAEPASSAGAAKGPCWLFGVKGRGLWRYNPSAVPSCPAPAPLNGALCRGCRGRAAYWASLLGWRWTAFNPFLALQLDFDPSLPFGVVFLLAASGNKKPKTHAPPPPHPPKKKTKQKTQTKKNSLSSGPDSVEMKQKGV